MNANHSDSEQSFYSVYSTNSRFDTNSVIPSPRAYQREQPGVSLVPPDTRMMKIAQSNVQLDDDEGDNDHFGERGFIEDPVSPSRVEMPSRALPSTEERDLLGEISAIEPAMEAPGQLDQSLHLLREIDCLSVEQISPHELREVKSKIEALKREQLTLQNSLSMANEMLRNTKRRNQLLEQEISRCKNEQKKGDQLLNSRFVPMAKLSEGHIEKQTRIFPQVARGESSPVLAKLKSVYQQCALNSFFCIYQNEGYKIEVFYERQKNVAEAKQLRVEIRLTAHHHIANKKQFRFGLSLSEKEKVLDTELSYDKISKFVTYLQWPEGLFNIELTIHEIDEPRNKRHNHMVMVPLPITHFLEPRLMMQAPQQAISVKKALSKYSLQLSGSISVTSLQKLGQKWWNGKFLSCLGWNELVLFEVRPVSGGTGVELDVYGRKNGPVTVGLLQFLSFYLTS